MAITWTEDGPEGSEEIEFSRYGVRIAVIGEEGRIELHDQWELDMFGGILPAVGDHIATLWGKGDPDPTEHYRVVARYYVGEFAGDTCWWLLIAPELSSDRDEAVFRLHESSSAKTRDIMERQTQTTFEALLKARKAEKLKDRRKSAATATRGRGAKSPAKKRRKPRDEGAAN